MEEQERKDRILAVFWEKHLEFLAAPKGPYLRYAHKTTHLKASALTGFDVTAAERLVAWRAYYANPQSAKVAYLAVTATDACLKHAVRAGGVKYLAGTPMSVMPADAVSVVPDRYWEH